MGLAAAGLFVFLGIALALAAGLLTARTKRRDFARRVDLITAARRPFEVHADALPPSDWTEQLNARVQRVFGVGLKARWGVKSSAIILLVYACVAALGVWVLGHLILKLPLAIILPAALAAAFLPPNMVLRMEQGRAEFLFIEQLPDAIDMVVRMIRAGLPVTAAIRYVGDEASAPVSSAFSRMADQIEVGVAVNEALAAEGERVKLGDFRFFAVAVSLQHVTGGNLAATLETLSDIVRKRRAMRMKAKAVTAEVRMSAYVLASMPFLVMAGLLVVNPHYLAPLITDRRGNIIVGIAVASLLTAFVTMGQMMRTATKV
jgi:tight adherence protein B